MAMVVEQDWRPKDLPPLDEAFNGDERVVLFLPGMRPLEAWEFIPWNTNAPVIVEFGEGRTMYVPGSN
jgi:hypothetical protein